MKELSLPIIVTKKINPRTGQFLKGHQPHNKGVPMKDWMDGRKIKKVLKGLQRNGNKNIGGCNAKKIIAIHNGKPIPFESSNDAERKTGIQARNIRSVCAGKRKHAGGYKWFYETDNRWLEEIQKIN